MDDYGFTLEQIENRVLADCNKERLKEHKQCVYCHLVFACRYYRSPMNKSLCQFLKEQEIK